jgi:hypothetical protein
MNWNHIQNSLEKVFSEATSIPFVWEEEPRQLITKPFGVLSLGQSITLGQDSHSYKFRDSDITLNLYGQREITITVQIFARQARGERSARALIERARLSLANPAYRDELRQVGLIFVENHPMVDLNFAFDQRHESRTAFDVVFRVVLHEQHTTKQPGFFEQVELKEAGLC